MLGLCMPLIPHVNETSFPSDHATLMFAASIYLVMHRHWRGIGVFLLVVTFLTAWARVYSGIHFPFDMFGSLFIGITCTFLLSIIKIQFASHERMDLAVIQPRFPKIITIGL